MRDSLRRSIISSSSLSSYRCSRSWREGNFFSSTSLCYRSTTPSLPRRVRSHAAAALINFCEDVERDTLLPYLDPVVERLLKLINATGDPATSALQAIIILA
ncbi:hypothetical protein L208DRAFT_1363928 [Tricholoma matsutake]|nr:hypothetical protein L208DRAFT_1363928 [Tricholoma matsutake 945]